MDSYSNVENDHSPGDKAKDALHSIADKAKELIHKVKDNITGDKVKDDHIAEAEEDLMELEERQRRNLLRDEALEVERRRAEGKVVHLIEGNKDHVDEALEVEAELEERERRRKFEEEQLAHEIERAAEKVAHLREKQAEQKAMA